MQLKLNLYSKENYVNKKRINNNNTRMTAIQAKLKKLDEQIFDKNKVTAHKILQNIILKP